MWTQSVILTVFTRRQSAYFEFIWIAHFKLRIAMWFGVHMVQNTVIRIIIWIAHLKLRITMWFWRTHGPNYRLSNFNSKCIQNAHFELNFKLRTLLSCENSHSVYSSVSQIFNFHNVCESGVNYKVLESGNKLSNKVMVMVFQHTPWNQKRIFCYKSITIFKWKG